MEVIVTGKLTTYPNRSSYQIVVETLEPAGLGALMALLEERKRKLAAEGLFDEARKQLLPFLPEVIGVVTSPTGAVIRDILHRLADRFPRHVIVWPVKVQGDGSAEQVAAAIRGFNALPDGGRIRRPDLLIVARGGGSLEDLWSFNEEIVVRAAAESMIPLISAVGHETDVTLIDFASDKRAPTPTAAAEMAVPVRADLIAELMSKARRALACWQRAQDHRRTELRAAARALPNAEELLAIPRQRLDACAERLPRALRANAQIHHTQFSRIAGRLAPQLLRGNVERRRLRLDACTHRLGTALKTYRLTQLTRIARARDRVTDAWPNAPSARPGRCSTTAPPGWSAPANCCAAFSYRGVLSRGFALVRDGADQPLRTAAAVQPGMKLDIEFSDGRVGATARRRSTASQARRQPAVPPSARRTQAAAAAAIPAREACSGERFGRARAEPATCSAIRAG